jgi:hypothetical protein
MLEIEKKRADQIEKTMSVSINLETGQSKLKVDEQDDEFSYARQNEEVNKYLQSQLGSKSNLYKPFETGDEQGEQTCEDLER